MNASVTYGYDAVGNHKRFEDRRPAVNYSDEPVRNPEMIILRSPKEARPWPVRHTSGF